MGSPAGIPITIQGKTVGTIHIDEKAMLDVCGEQGMEVAKSAGDLLSVALKSTALDNEIKQLDSVQSDFISSFPHELRIPITVIKDALSMLLEGVLGDTTDDQKKALVLAADNVDRLWRLSEELLELSKILSVKTPMKRTLLDIGAVTSRAAKKFEQAARDKEVTLAVNVPNRKIEIWADEAKLDRMLGCLIDNAIRYNKKSGRVDVSITETGPSVDISVADTGAGIPPEDIGRVFDKFLRVTMRASGEAKIWGVGLPIVKEIVDMHRGNIAVQSEVGKGSTFTVTLAKSLR